MPAKTTHCVYCHRSLGRQLHRTPEHPYICDLCSEAIRTHVEIVPLPKTRKPAGNSASPQAVTPLAPGGRKSNRRSDRKRAVVATALLGMLLPFVGCTLHRETHLQWGGLHRETTLDVRVDPNILSRPCPPAAAVEISTPEALPTES